MTEIGVVKKSILLQYYEEIIIYKIKETPLFSACNLVTRKNYV